MTGLDHVPVLTAEVLERLEPRPGETCIDCTAGLGGHAALVAERIGPEGHLVLLDADPSNLERARARIEALPGAPRITAVPSNFEHAETIARRQGWVADLLLADLGVSSSQLDDPARGFSFTTEGPLDMRMDPGLVGTAADLVNNLPVRRLGEIIERFGEEPLADRIAKRIDETRRTRPLATTVELAEVVRDAYGSRARRSRIHPATRTFMALRIAVNDELGAIERLLGSVRRGAEAVRAGAATWLAPGARVAFISFHSLEDRLVKHAFRAMVRDELGVEPHRRATTASEAEQNANPRSRSAKLRVLHLSGRC